MFNLCDVKIQYGLGFNILVNSYVPYVNQVVKSSSISALVQNCKIPQRMLLCFI